jgi:hypothetical protein
VSKQLFRDEEMLILGDRIWGRPQDRRETYRHEKAESNCEAVVINRRMDVRDCYQHGDPNPEG